MNENELRLIRMADVELQKVDWLWFPFIPFGKISMIQADPGEGKTTLALRLAAACSRGFSLPNTPEQERVPINVIRANKRRPNRLGEVNKYSGLLYCSDCGSSLSLLCKKSKGGRIGFQCSNYRNHSYRNHSGCSICTPHRIKETQLDQIVLEEINKALYFARTRTDEFAEYISQKTSAQSRKELNAKTKELAKAKHRSSELATLFTRLYEDSVLGRISEDQYKMLSEAYTNEKRELDAAIPDLEQEVERLKESTSNVQHFTDLAKKYVVIEELTTEILHTFISKIVIHEREKKWGRNSPQQIDIYFRYIDFPTCLDRQQKLNDMATETDE